MRKASLSDVVKSILDLNSKYLRKVLNAEIQTTLSHSQEFAKEYENVLTSFQIALAKAENEGASTFSVKNTTGNEVSFNTESASKASKGESSYGTQFNIYSKLIPGLAAKWQLGHKSASVVTLRIAASINTLRQQKNPANENLIRQLLILLEASREIDKITKGSNFTLQEVYNILGRLNKNPPKLNASIKKEIKVFSESKAELTLEFEDANINLLKGSAQSVLGKLTTRLINGQIQSITEGIKKVDITQLTASPSFFDELKKLLLDSIDPKTTPKSIKRKSSKSDSGSSGSNIKKLPRLRKAPPAPRPRTTPETSSMSIQTLLSYINGRLPETVRSKMDYPRLENRTGRFASSTEVITITPTPNGFPSIAYTYQKNPYQVFEKGRGKFPWATPYRDPRLIIEESIRDIAREVTQARFYMRRL